MIITNTENLDEMTKHQKHRRNLRTLIISAYGGKCNCCGEDWIDWLEVDHINNDGKARRGNLRTNYTEYRWLRDNIFPRELCKYFVPIVIQAKLRD